MNISQTNLPSVVTCRDHVGRIELLDLRNVAGDRRRCHKIDFAAERRLLFLAVEMAFGAVPLQASDRTGMARLGIKVGDLLNGQGVVGVEGCPPGRDVS